MNKITILILSAFLVVALAIFAYTIFIFNQKKAVENPATASDVEIISILKTNPDIKKYTQQYPDFSITGKEILTKDSIASGQQAGTFQAVYNGLMLEDNRYMKVNLMDKTGSHGFVAVIDFSNRSVVRDFGIILFQASAKTTQPITAP